MRIRLTILLSLSVCCGSAQTYTLRGHFAGKDGDYVVSDYGGFHGAAHKDTAYLQKNTFRLSGVLPAPVHASLTVYPRGGGQPIYSTVLWLDPADMEIDCDTANKGFPTVKGGRTQREDQEISQNLANHQDNPGEVFRGYLSSYVLPQLVYAKLIQKQMSADTARWYYDHMPSGVRNSPRGQQLRECILFTAASLPGQPAPAIDTIDLEGRKVSLSSFLGHPVIVDFWASWCVYCREFTPHIKALARRYKDLVVVFVSTDKDRDTLAWKKAVADDSIDHFFQVRAGFYVDGSAQMRYAILPIPSDILIDPSGKIVGRYMGQEPGNAQELDSALEAMHAAPHVTPSHQTSE